MCNNLLEYNQDLLQKMVDKGLAYNKKHAKLLIQQLDVEYLYDADEVTIEQIKEMLTILTNEELVALDNKILELAGK